MFVVERQLLRECVESVFHVSALFRSLCGSLGRLDLAASPASGIPPPNSIAPSRPLAANAAHRKVMTEWVTTNRTNFDRGLA